MSLVFVSVNRCSLRLLHQPQLSYLAKRLLAGVDCVGDVVLGMGGGEDEPVTGLDPVVEQGQRELAQSLRLHGLRPLLRRQDRVVCVALVLDA